MIMRELPEPRVSYIHLGGDFTRKGAPVTPGVLGVCQPLESTAANAQPAGSGALAGGPAQSAHRARDRQSHVAAVFRQRASSIPRTISARRATSRLIRNCSTGWRRSSWSSGWSQKAIHRLIVTSATYRQSSLARRMPRVDPENRLLARQNRLRLDAEIIRDAALVASGLLDAEGRRPERLSADSGGANKVTQVKREWVTATGPDRYRRGLYTFFQRSARASACLCSMRRMPR